MEEYSTQQVSQLNEVNQQLEARLTRTTIVAVTDMIEKEMSYQTLPCHFKLKTA